MLEKYVMLYKICYIILEKVCYTLQYMLYNIPKTMLCFVKCVMQYITKHFILFIVFNIVKNMLCYIVY